MLTAFQLCYITVRLGGTDTNLLHVVLSENPSVVFMDVLLLPVLREQRLSLSADLNT